MGVSVQRMAPVLPTRSVKAALDHYQRLGFSVDAYDGAGDPVYGFVGWDGAELFHLVLTPDLQPRANTSACYLYVDDADALHQQWQEARVGGRVEPVRDTEYDLREFVHVDPDGNLIRVGSAKN